jgi:type IV pilus assembly protein PilY1
MNWYYAGRTWFSNGSPGDGYLHVAVDDLTDNHGNSTAAHTNLLNKLDPKENDETGYMSCNAGDKNNCSYVVNAGLTPTGGTLQSAINYFKGEGIYSSPIQAWCQKNFIIYVTDGLPSVDESGVPKSADDLMPSVLAKLSALRNISKTISGASYNFDVKTYVLGVGLSDEAKPKLDGMAVQGGTDVTGHAYYADDPQQLLEALGNIFKHIIGHAYSYTSPTIPSVRLIDNDVVYVSSFTPNETPFWPGSLKAYQLEADGTLPVNVNGEPLKTPLWEASLPAPNSRVIKTVTGGALKDFTNANVTPGDLGVGTTTERDALVTYVRSVNLGDIFHSNSVIVGSPSNFFEDDGFSGPGEFYQTNKNRT